MGSRRGPKSEAQPTEPPRCPDFASLNSLSTNIGHPTRMCCLALQFLNLVEMKSNCMCFPVTCFCIQIMFVKCIVNCIAVVHVHVFGLVFAAV